MSVSVCEEDFNVGEELELIRSGRTDIGAVASFVGLVREYNIGDSVEALYLEHYPAMTCRSIEAIVEEAKQRWQLNAVRVVHRVGQLYPGDQIVLVATASHHRGDAFEACEFIMDYLKTRAPFWKKERAADGERWVEARQSDSDAAARWNNNNKA